jgi:probable rRNA maturation factor
MSQFEVEIQYDAVLPSAIGSQLHDALVATLHHEQVASPAALTLLLTDDDTIHSMNQAYRNVDKTTDVLSFPDGEPMVPGAPVYLGDIAISVPQASRQAEKWGHSLLGELQLLVVHGTLHLLGHDHGDSAEKAAMWQAQTAILTQIDAPVTVPREDE